MSIYTKTGDSGDTSLFDGTRVSKTHPRVVAYGDVDEVQACLGVVRAAGLPTDLDEMCLALQRDLFALGARLADPSHKIARRVEKIVIDDGQQSRGSRAGSIASIPRSRRCVISSCRTAPPRARRCTSRARCAVAPSGRCSRSGADAVEPVVIVYLNRLSDLLFTMARAANHRAGVTETPW